MFELRFEGRVGVGHHGPVKWGSDELAQHGLFLVLSAAGFRGLLCSP